MKTHAREPGRAEGGECLDKVSREKRMKLAHSTEEAPKGRRERWRERCGH